MPQEKFKKITVTSPLLPDLDKLNLYFKDVWGSKWLTNNGQMHDRLESELKKYFGVDYVSLVSNGTLALQLALKVLDLKGEVITTPYSFVATSNAILLSNLKPVFVDIDRNTLNIDPRKIEGAITEKTSAILAVHVYGNPCEHDKIQAIADKYGLKIIYDAAHAFGVKQDGVSVLTYGDLSVLSFHATKAYSTIEGGAIICHTKEMYERLKCLKNFGFSSPIELTEISSNSKLNEIQCSFGLATLEIVDEAILKRNQLYETYRRELKGFCGIEFIQPLENINYNNSYMPVIVDRNIAGFSRDDLSNHLESMNVFSRKYFYPIITEFEAYKELQPVIIGELGNSKYVSENVLCLPIHHELDESDVVRICNMIKELS